MKTCEWFNMSYIAFLFGTLISGGAGGFECPGHPAPSEIVEQEEREQRQNDPKRELLSDDQKREYDKNDGGDFC